MYPGPHSEVTKETVLERKSRSIRRFGTRTADGPRTSSVRVGALMELCD